MAINVDLTRALRNPHELADLVQAIFAAGPADEADWIEWKSQLDLSQKEVQGTLARHILGMANRKPSDAARYSGGCGYLVVGIEPGKCDGVTEVDPAVLGQGIEPYLGADGPSWGMAYVGYSGKSVLVVTIEPPQSGMRIFTLQKECPKPGGGSPYLAGAIFVRRPGRTIQAEPGDIQALVERYADVSQPIALVIRHSNGGQPLEVSPLPDVAPLIAEWTRRRRLELIPPPKPPAPARPTAAGGGLGLDPTALEAMAAAAADAGRFLDNIAPPDRRTPEQFVGEVDRYLLAASRYYTELAETRFAADPRSRMALALANASDRNYTEVQVQVTLPGQVRAYDPAEIESTSDDLPVPPKPLGTRQGLFSRSRLDYPFVVPPLSVTSGLVRRKYFRIRDSSQINYDRDRVRPEQHLDLDQVVLFTRQPEGSVLKVEWAATAANVDGLVRGNLELRVGNSIRPEELLPELVEGAVVPPEA